MKNIIAALFVLAATPSWAWTTVPDYADDFAKARECHQIDGRKVWAGERAFYIQSWLFQTGDSKLLDDDSASVVALAENTDEALKAFREACG